MAILSASAKLYTGIRCWCVDKNISAALTASFSLGNKNRPASGGDTVFANVLAFKLRRAIADLVVTPSLAVTNERYKTYGGGNNVITPGASRVIDNTNNWRVTASVVCKFPTYFRIDVDKLQLPQGTTCTVSFEEDWIRDGVYLESTKAPSAAIGNFFTFRTPWQGASFINSVFSLPANTVLRIRQSTSTMTGVASLVAYPIFNPGKFAALFAGVSQIVPSAVKKAVSGANMLSAFGPSAMAVTGFLRTASVNTSDTFTSTVNALRVRIFSSNVMPSMSTLNSTGNRIRFGVSSNSAIFTSSVTTLESRRRNTSSTISSLMFVSNALVGKIIPFSSTVGNISASMNVTATKIGLLYEILNPNPVGTPANDRFGYDVAINNSYFAVSSPGEDEGAETDTGRVFIYNTSTGTLVRTLLGNNFNSFGTPQEDQFGRSLAFNPANAVELAVGTPFEENGYSNNGRVNVINVSNGALISTYTLNSTVATGSWEQGQDVDISSNYVVIGSRVRVDIRNRTTGNIAFSVLTDSYDSKVAIFGNNVLVGVSSINTVYIYNASTGALVRTLTGPVASSGFGSSVALNGTYAVIGAEMYDAGGFVDVGRVYVYNLSNGALVRTLDYPTPNRDYINFGGSVAITDSHILVGGSIVTADGHYHLFEINGSRIRSWEEGNTGLGDAVSIYGDYFIVGGIWKTSGASSVSGWARVYSLNKP